MSHKETEQQWHVLVLVNALRAAGLAVEVQRGYAENTSPTAIAVMVGAKPE
jgi:hypothetical protein